MGARADTKAADVGADLAGKVVEDLPEDDPHNPGTIADNVGDNVGDVAGMGSDLFGSFGEATCAALLVGASSPALVAAGWGALMFPLTINGAGIIVCLITNFFATDFMPVKKENDIESVLKTQLLVSSLLMTPTLYFLADFFLPTATCGVCVGGFVVGGICSSPLKAFFCVAFGALPARAAPARAPRPRLARIYGPRPMDGVVSMPRCTEIRHGSSVASRRRPARPGRARGGGTSTTRPDRTTCYELTLEVS